MSTQNDVKLVKPENTLKKKVGDGGFNKEDIKRAQDAIDNTDIDFAPQGLLLLDRLKETLGDIRSGKIKSGRVALDELIYPLLQLKAQGGMFNYPTITQITTDILLFLEDIKKIDKDLLKIMDSYHQSAKIILEHNLKDVQSATAVQIANELKAVCTRYTLKRTPK